ncbi:protein-lysine N-methyltransferase EEF2KMT isoform X3 [Phalacrocorax carbo]|uniref:protein-lysine N-methyltransferase EEF2KMT isoform X3 n=1 Tax=Phalacrocorax carbo TaxID=9209 RepID=UPI0031199BA1
MAELELGSRFQRRFLAARQLRSFPWAELEQKLRARPGSPLLAEILQKTILHPLCVKYPPSTKYRRCFLTELIKKHESTAAEPLDELYDALADILNEEESSHGYKNYLLPTGECVTLSESVAIISGGTTGLVTWDAALHLTEWAIENSSVFSNSDCRTFPCYIASGVTDVVYDPEIILTLIGMLQKLSASRADRKPPEVYIAFTIRNPDTYHLFQAELDKVGIGWQIIPAHSNSIFLYDMQPNVTILQLFI